jgi:excisionase family DNA binding protein
MLNKLLRGEAVAQLLSISKAFAYQVMAAGKIPVVRLGRSVRVRPEDLEK